MSSLPASSFATWAPVRSGSVSTACGRGVIGVSFSICSWSSRVAIHELGMITVSAKVPQCRFLTRTCLVLQPVSPSLEVLFDVLPESDRAHPFANGQADEAVFGVIREAWQLENAIPGDRVFRFLGQCGLVRVPEAAQAIIFDGVDL